GLVAVSEKTRTCHGPVDGHDGVFARLCGLRVSYPLRAQGARGHLSGPKRQAHSVSHRPMGLPLLCGNSCALHPGARALRAQSDRRALAPAAAPGKAICVVLPIKNSPKSEPPCGMSDKKQFVFHLGLAAVGAAAQLPLAYLAV